jgi:hypothetical protein
MCVHRHEIHNEAQCAQDHKECKAADDDDGNWYKHDGFRDLDNFAATAGGADVVGVIKQRRLRCRDYSYSSL